jgi:hypothetical protein
MKSISIILISVCIIHTESLSQNPIADSNLPGKRDSILVTQDNGNKLTIVALTTLKVCGQTAGGILGGVVGGAILSFNPVTYGAGFILGSSYSVYLIGDIANGRGQYKWVLLAGTINGVLYTPIFLNNQHSGFGMIGVVALAMLTSMASEIVTFYATQKDCESKVRISMTMLPSQKNHSYTPTLNVRLNF